MSEDASFEVQKAIVAALKADAAVNAIIKGRIYDSVPSKDGKANADFPYVSFGPEQEIPEHHDCIEAGEIFLQLDAWSRKPGFPEVKKLARAIEDALDDAELALADNAAVYISYDGRQILRDPDGLTSHAAMTFRIGIEKH